MEREQIVRTDFPPSRKGWDPDAVRAHLEQVAESVDATPAAAPTLGDLAASRVRTVLEAAESAAGEIGSSARADAEARRAEAQAEAQRTLADARAESERILAEARSSAEGHTTTAREAFESLIAEAERLRGQVAELGERVAAAGPAAEVPGPVIVPEPTPPTIPEPTPDPVPEPTPDPVPEPTPDPAPEPTPDPTPDPAPELPAAGSAEATESPEGAAGPSTEDLIAQLRGRTASAPNGSDAPSAPAISGSDLGAARLVAMNMALDGSPRERIAAQIRTEFGDVPDLDGMLDEVLARAGA